jgi:hypothetical protein
VEISSDQPSTGSGTPMPSYDSLPNEDRWALATGPARCRLPGRSPSAAVSSLDRHAGDPKLSSTPEDAYVPGGGPCQRELSGSNPQTGPGRCVNAEFAIR